MNLTPYVVIERGDINESGGGFMNPERFAYLGPVFSTYDDVYEKYDFEDINEAPYTKTSPGGWVALIQHYFLTAWVPDNRGTYKYQGKLDEGSKRYRIGYTAKSVGLAPGGQAEATNTLYVGPKYPADLSKIQENLSLTVDYGFLFWLGKPMYWVLEKGDGLFNNWGVAIIFLTVIVKLLTWPLSAKAYKSMGKMRVIQPKMLALQERYGGDKQKMSQEMMELYRKEGVNPLGGCLPMLLQMPFFLAFYWVLLETVQLRHSGFLWLDDLSAMDPFFVLPILNALGMYLSQKMTPTPPNSDPMQAKIMKFMPVMFAVLFAWFPAGLVLYWLTNMLIQILQQWWYAKTPKPSN
jgi:YidC/Oxa1 family membrane protein insertase